MIEGDDEQDGVEDHREHDGYHESLPTVDVVFIGEVECEDIDKMKIIWDDLFIVRGLSEEDIV